MATFWPLWRKKLLETLPRYIYITVRSETPLSAHSGASWPLMAGRFSPRPCAGAETRFDVVVEVATAFAVAAMTPATL